MLLHTQVASVSHFHEKIEFDEKKVSNFHFLNKFLKGYFKALPGELIFDAKNFFFIEF